MRNRQHSRLLTSLLLVAAMSVVLGTNVLAASQPGSGSIATSTWTIDKPAKPISTPLVGEPDAPGGPLPPKVGTPPTGGSSSLVDWTVRLQLWLQSLLVQSPKRLP